MPSGVIKLTGATSISGNSGAVIIDSRSDIIFADSGSINSSTSSPSGVGGNITLIAKNAISLANNKNFISSTTTGSGNGGDINITGKSVSLTNGAQIGATTSGSGSGGDINITGKSVSLTNDAQIGATTSGSGKGGNLTVRALDSVEIIGELQHPDTALITSPSGSGNGGNLTIETGRLVVRDGGVVTTASAGAGKAGDLTVKTSDSVELIGIPKVGYASGLFSGSVGDGDGGNIKVETGRLIVKDGAQIAADNFPSGNGKPGNVTVIAHQSVEVSGTSPTVKGSNGFLFPSAIVNFTENDKNAGDLTIETPQLRVLGGASISAGTDGIGQGGTVKITASDFMEVSGSSSQGLSSRVRSITSNDGNGGNMLIDTGRLSVKDGARIDTRTLSPSGQVVNGNSGNITIKTNIFEASGGGQIIASTDDNGQGGKISVTATDRVTLSGVDNAFDNKVAQLKNKGDSLINESASSGIVTRAKDNATGKGGDIEIITPSLSMTDGAQLSASTSGRGDAGKIQVNAKDSTSISGVNSTTGVPSGLFTNTQAAGSAGDLSLSTGQLIVEGGGQVSAYTVGTGRAGTLSVKADSIEVTGISAVDGTTRSSLIFDSSAVGDAGKLSIDTRILAVRNGGQVSAKTSNTGQAGILAVNASDSVEVSGTSTDGKNPSRLIFDSSLLAELAGANNS